MEATLTAVKADLQDLIKETETKIDLWGRVTRKHRCDGSDFKSFRMNFTGCEVVNSGICGHSLKVGGVLDGKYITDEIPLTHLVRYSKFSPSEDRIVRRQYLEPCFTLTPDEAEQEINDRITTLEEKLASYREQLLLADRAFYSFKEAIDKAVRDLKRTAGKRSALYYGVRDYMKEVY